MISKNVDLIAIMVLLLMFAFSERVRGLMYASFHHSRVLHVRSVRKMVITPPRV